MSRLVVWLSMTTAAFAAYYPSGQWRDFALASFNAGAALLAHRILGPNTPAVGEEPSK